MAANVESASAKKPTNLSIRSDLLARARELDLNLSATLEAALVAAIREEEKRRWLHANRGAIAAYNERFDGQRVFSDGLRGF